MCDCNIFDSKTNANLKISGQFYNAARMSSKRTIIKLVYSILKFIALEIFVAIYYSMNPGMTSIQIGLIAAQISALLLVIYNGRAIFAVRIAKSIGHTREEGQPVKLIYPCVWLSDIRSEKYTFGPDQLTDQQNKKCQLLLAKSLPKLASNKFIHLIRFVGLASSIALIIFFIIALASYPTDSTVQRFLIAYIIIEFITKIRIFLSIILVIFYPLAALIMCCCCRNRRKSANEVPNPNNTTLAEFEVKKVTDMLQQAQQCKICFESFKMYDEVVKIPCEKNHSFHAFCINQWNRMSNTCPICRDTL